MPCCWVWPPVRRPRRLALLLILVSATLSTLGNHLLAPPAVIGRAHSAQRQLELVKAMRDADPAAFGRPVYLDVRSRHQFMGIGVAGLAYTLDAPLEDFVVLGPTQAVAGQALVLVVPETGDVYRRPAAP